MSKSARKQAGNHTEMKVENTEKEFEADTIRTVKNERQAPDIAEECHNDAVFEEVAKIQVV